MSTGEAPQETTISWPEQIREARFDRRVALRSSIARGRVAKGLVVSPSGLET
jgi:hypothetical protein